MSQFCRFKINIIIFPLLFALFLPACSTRYSAANCDAHAHLAEDGAIQEGYTEKRVSHDRFLITFQGNRYTSYAQVRAFALKRASEVTEAAGYSYFSILQEKDISSAEKIHQKRKREIQKSLHPEEETVKQFAESQGQLKKLAYPAISLLIECSFKEEKGFSSVSSLETHRIHALPKHSSP